MKQFAKHTDSFADIHSELLKRGARTVAWRGSTPPTEGTPIRGVKSVKPDAVDKVDGVICHRDGSHTVVTNLGFIRYFN